MTSVSEAPIGATPTLGPDRALPFQVEALEVRGRVATFDQTLSLILDRHAYPEPVSRLLGEAIVMASLLYSTLKDVGRFILQASGDGPVSMLVVDIRAPGLVRATAGFDEEALADLGRPSGAEVLLGTGTLAMTVELGRSGQRYQGFVELGGSLEDVAHRYFEQSEQIPTKVRLAVAELFDRDAAGEARRHWRGGGLIAQFLPRSEERVRRRDLAPGDPPPGSVVPEGETDDAAWVEALALVETVADDELTDPSIPAERLLYRLFHERGVRVFEGRGFEEKCTCSRERIRGVLEAMGADEIVEATVEGEITVTCEFCGLVYRFEPDEVRIEAAGA